MLRKLPTKDLAERGRTALEKSLSEFPPIKERLAMMVQFENSVFVVEYIIPGKTPEDAVLVARARVDRTNGFILSVETFLPHQSPRT